MILFSNNASSTVAGSITTTATSVALAAGTGVKFPNPTGGDYFVATFYDQTTKTINEIVHVTARSGDICTIVRAQEGTVASAWSAADIFANLVTAGTLEAFVQAGTGPADTSVIYVGTDTGTVNHIIATTNPVPPSYQVGMQFNIKVKNTNTGPTDLQFNGVAAVRASRQDGSDLIGGNVTASEEMIFVYNGVDFTAMIPPVPLRPPQYIFYVRTDGNDNNTGFANTPQDAFATVSGGMYQIKNRYISAQTVTIRVADGTYVDAFGDSLNYVSAWNIVGNTTNPGNVIIDATSVNQSSYPAHAIGAGVAASAADVANITVNGFTFRSYYENAVAGKGILFVLNCNFTAPTSGQHGACAAVNGGIVSYYGNCQYTGASAVPFIFQAIGGAVMAFGEAGLACTFNIAGTPVVTSATIVVAGAAAAWAQVITFTGGVPNCAQYNCSSAGGIGFTGGVTTVFPGTLPGVVTPPGWTA
jgi:hypothetical protein